MLLQKWLSVLPSGRVKLGKTKALILENVAPGTKSGDALAWQQAPKLTANNAFTGANTHTGTETFSNATGVTTAKVTPATSGEGTETKRPVVAVTGATSSPTKWNGVYTLSKADGIAVTLPAIATVDIGTVLTFPILTSCTSVGYVISSATGDVMIGGLWCTIANPDAANDMEFNIAASTNNTLTLGATTACGLAGGCVEFIAISATQWFVRGTVLGSGSLATNLFTTV
jgi:hypothetical protein